MVELPSRLKAVIAITIITIFTEIIAIFLFKQIDTLINSELYTYGLQFNINWATEYWSYSNLIFPLLIFGVISASFSVAILALLKRKIDNFQFIPFLSLIGLAVANSMTTYYFTRVDFLVNNTLYDYGLQFSLNWITPYQANMRIASALVGLSALFAFFSIILIFAGERKGIRLTTQKIVYSTLLLIGVTAFAISIFYGSQILALIGLGLIFWGIILAYIRSEDYIQKDLADAIVFSQKPPITQMLTDFGFKGSAIYLPPRYLKDMTESKVYISKSEIIALPTIDKPNNPAVTILPKIRNGLFITPPGAELAKLFERNLGSTFIRMDFLSLQQDLPKLLTETLELMQSFEIEKRNREISAKAGNIYYKTLAAENESSSLGSILGSSIACVLAKSLGEPIILRNQKINEKNQTVIMNYYVLNDLAREKR